MRKLILSAVLAATALGAVAPAAAQYRDPRRDQGYGYNNPYAAQNYAARIENLHRRIHMLDERGAFSRQESYRLNREVDQLQALYSRYRYDGISPRERYDLDRRIAWLRDQVREDRFDGRYDDRRHPGDRRYPGDRRWEDDRRDRDSRWERDERRDRDDRRDRDYPYNR